MRGFNLPTWVMNFRVMRGCGRGGMHPYWGSGLAMEDGRRIQLMFATLTMHPEHDKERNCQYHTAKPQRNAEPGRIFLYHHSPLRHFASFAVNL
jgi:hypothetical protein